MCRERTGYSESLSINNTACHTFIGDRNGHLFQTDQITGCMCATVLFGTLFQECGLIENSGFVSQHLALVSL